MDDKTVVIIQREGMDDLILEFESCTINLSRNVKKKDDASFCVGEDCYAVIHGYCTKQPAGSEGISANNPVV